MTSEMHERFQKFNNQMNSIRKFIMSGNYPPEMNSNVKRQMRKQSNAFKMEGDKLYRCRRGNWVEIITSPSQAYEILKFIHEDNGSHIGIVKTKSRVSIKYYWYGMSHDVIDYVSLCPTCQQSEKFKKPSHTSTQTISDPLEIEGMELNENSASAEGTTDITELPLRRVKIKKHVVREYVTCFVPTCKNTTWTAPDKRFIAVPQSKTKKREWWVSVGRDFPMVEHQYYCCEDHFDLREDATNYLFVKMMGGKLKLKEGVVPHIFPCKEEHLSQEDLMKMLEENLSDNSSVEEDDDTEICEAYVLEPPVKHVGVQTPMLHFRNELSDKWMEFDQDTSILSCLTQRDDLSTQSELQRRVSSNNSSICLFSDPLEIHESTSGLAHRFMNDDDDDDDDDNDDEEYEDPAVLLASGKGTKLMKLLRKYRKEKKFSSAPLQEWKSSSVTRRQFPVDDGPQCMTQIADHRTFFEENEVHPKHDPFTINIDGVTYRSIFKAHEEIVLSNYIASEVMKRTFLTIPVLCNMVYDFCVMYGFDRPPAWDMSQSADKEWLQGFMKRHPFIDWHTIINKNKSRILKPSDKVEESSGFIFIQVIQKEENEDEKPTLCDTIALDHNYALSTMLQPL